MYKNSFSFTDASSTQKDVSRQSRLGMCFIKLIHSCIIRIFQIIDMPSRSEEWPTKNVIYKRTLLGEQF